jgi:periplasmic protein TonB
MKHLFIPLIIAALFMSATNAQAQKGPKVGYGVAIEQTPAQFPGGDDSLAVFLQKNFKYARQEQAHGKHGQVNVGFTVDKEGKIKDPFVLNGAGKEIDEEAVRVVQAMPAWKPGTSAGTAVEVQYILPIDYFLPE